MNNPITVSPRPYSISDAAVDGLLRGLDAASAILLYMIGVALTYNGSPLSLLSRILDVIDRRLYRRKYDAEQTLSRFSQIARDEVDIDRLRASLVNVVQEAMQPAHLSLWLKESGRAAVMEEAKP